MAGTSTFSTEYTRIAKFIGDSSAGTLVYIKQAINDAYRTLAEAEDWPWLHYEGAVNMVATYSTGTVTIVDSTTDYMTTTGTWSTSWSPVRVKTAAGHVYTLTYNTGNSRWEMDRDLVEAESAVTYTLYKDRYALAARLRSLYLANTSINPDFPVEIVKPVQMAVLKSGGLYTANPVRALCFVDADTSVVSQVEIYPIPDTAHSLHYRGYRQVADLSGDSDVFLFPGSLLSVFRHLALSYAFDWRGNTERSLLENKKYEEELAKAIERMHPDAGAGSRMVLDPHYFAPRNYRDDRPRAGIG